MATIRTTLALYDGVTGPLKAMCRGMNALINTMDSVKDTFGDSFDPTVLQQIREDLAEATVGFDQMEQNIRQADKAQSKFNNTIQEGSSAAGGMLSQIKKIAVAVGGLATVKKLVDLSDDLSSTKARLNLIVDDGGSVTELEQKIMASAQRSRASYLTTAKAISQMGLMAGDAFANNDELIAFTETLNKAFVNVGAGTQQIEAATLQLTQAMASGVLRGEELNSVFENAQPVIQAIADYLGEPIGKIRTLAAEGKITADIVKNSLLMAADDINAKFESMPMTWGQVFTKASNIALQVIQPLLNGINWLADNISIIGPAVLALAGAFAVFQIAAHWTEIAAAATAIYHGVVNFLSIGFGILTGNTAAASAAVFTFNSALLANPIVWVVMLIMILIGALYAAVAAVNKFAGTSVSATGIICGAFMAALAFIGNIFIALWNVAAEVFVLIYNLVATVANFIGNVFNDPVGAVCRLFFDLADTVLGVLQALASAIDAIFGSNLAGAVQGWRDSLGGWVDETFGKGTEVMAKMSADDLKLDRFEYGAAFDLGYNFGEGIDSKVSDLFDGSAMDSMGAFDIGNTLDGIYGNTGDTAENTVAMSDALDITEEDLSYLRDIAEREAINRFTTAEISVDMSGMQNNISNGMDLDGVISGLTEGVNEAIDSMAEGVHT